jgi:nitrous oxide reductase
LREVLRAWLFSTSYAGAWELTANSKKIMGWKVFQSTRDRATSLDAILSVLRDCERA